ncbi:MAG: NAD(P)-binding domain-containing protein, partial [Lachnospiraceae bacterium]|nr:NAD(P)-binding domain-containing protein [Candidatus Hippenecus merdae]
MRGQKIDTQKNSIAILGAGTWGTALARLFAVRGMDVTVWSISAEEVETYTCTRRHPRLPGMQIPSNISFTTEINCISEKDYVMFAVPSVFIRSTAEKAAPYVTPCQVVMSVAKGIEKGTLISMTEILHEVLPENRIVALSGPTHAEEVAL